MRNVSTRNRAARRACRLLPAGATVLILPLLLGTVRGGPGEEPGSVSTPPSQAPPRESVLAIVALDPETGEVGAAIASSRLAVGARSLKVEAGVGAAVLQNATDNAALEKALQRLSAGRAPAEAVRVLPRGGCPQLALVDNRGRAATAAGDACMGIAGSRTGDGFAAQVHLVASQEALDRMEKAFQGAPGTLAQRLLSSLVAGVEGGSPLVQLRSAAVRVAAAPGPRAAPSAEVDLRVDVHFLPHLALRGLLRAESIEALRGEGRDQAAAGKVAEALETLRRLLAVNPVDELALMDLAAVLVRAGDQDQALQAIERSLDLRPDLRPLYRLEPAFAPLREEPRFQALVRDPTQSGPAATTP